MAGLRGASSAAPDEMTTTSSPLAMPTAIPQQQHQQHQQHQQFQSGYAQWPASYGQVYEPYPQTHPQYATVQNQPIGEASPQQQQQHGQGWSYGAPGAQEILPSRLLPPERKSWKFTKMGFCAANIVVAIIVLGLTFALMNRGAWGHALIALCPIPAVALVWSAAELITRVVRSSKLGIHPGAHVALHLLLMLACFCVGGVCVTVSVITDTADESRYCGYYDDECTDVLGGRKDVFVTLSAFYVILAVINLILFVGACADTARRNRASRNRPVLVIQNPGAYWGGWQPPTYAYPKHQPEQQQPQQPQPSQVQSPIISQAPVQGNPSLVSSPSVAMAQPAVERSEGPSEPPHVVHEFYAPSEGTR